MQKQRGKAWYIYHVNDVSVYLGYGYRQRGGGVPHQKNELEARLRPYLVVSAPTAGVANVLEAKNIMFLIQNEKHMRKMHSFNGRPSPLCLPR